MQDIAMKEKTLEAEGEGGSISEEDEKKESALQPNKGIEYNSCPSM